MSTFATTRADFYAAETNAVLAETDLALRALARLHADGLDQPATYRDVLDHAAFKLDLLEARYGEAVA